MTGGQKIGPYTLLERLGAGGIGEVWKARDSRLNRVVAIKFITAARQGSSPAAELLREARAASALNHPNIITIFDVGESEAGTYLAMEFVPGETLRARLNRPPIPMEEGLGIAEQVVGGLAAAHREGIIHRDLKPENIMLRVDGLVKVLDFGLAKVLPWAQPQTAGGASVTAGSQATETGQLVGTFTYMSPEQARGGSVTPASDVFSFGIILYEVLAGEHPFKQTTVIDTLTAILSREPPPVSARDAAVPEQISGVVELALRKEVSGRPRSAVELSDELKRARAALAAPPPAVHYMPRWMRAIGVALIAGLLTMGSWFLGSSTTRPGAPPLRSIAVMTFRAEAGDDAASALAQALSEELGAAVSRTGFQVAARRSVLELAGPADPRVVGAQLGVDAVLEGSVRSYRDKVKVHVELISTRTGFQMWGDTITADIEDPMGGEQQAAGEIAKRLRSSFSR
jgi:serine/threonine protein kinase